jgi:hypothetical protein
VAKAMKADEVRQFSKALSIDEVPVPQVGPGQSLASKDRSLG